jgi:outer membrane lipoprotein LolB
MSILRNGLALAMSAVLSACGALAPRDDAPQAPSFDLLGRMAVNYDGRALSSGVRWQHRDDSDEIWLLVPTGQALAHIRAGAMGATLTTADRTEYHASDVQSLMSRALGWELPIGHLKWWVRGEAVPGVLFADDQRDPHGRLVRLRQDGWLITFVPPAEESEALPQRLDLVREGRQVRLVIDGWRLDGGTP